MSGCDDALFPEIHVVCPACAAAFRLGEGLDPYETLWMHEHDCALVGDAVGAAGEAA
jgi:hypothetical protein